MSDQVALYIAALRSQQPLAPLAELRGLVALPAEHDGQGIMWTCEMRRRLVDLRVRGKVGAAAIAVVMGLTPEAVKRELANLCMPVGAPFRRLGRTARGGR